MAQEQQKREDADFAKFLTGHGAGHSRQRFAAGETVYSQGSSADAVFYIEDGWVKIAVVLPSGKEAVIALRGKGDFVGTRCLIGRRSGMTVALTTCSLIRVTKSALIRMLREEPDFAVKFATYLVWASTRGQERFVDQLINPAERRLARTLLQLAENNGGDDPRLISAPINQAILASMIGTTRPRVSAFMNKFKRQGFIEYDRNGHIRVHDGLRGFLLKR